ncbi:MAG: hypothetical protein FWC13_01935 [Oscillospiraceae bacterium]|nr:hypothetical protein [Oscillospiraceae bacterium]
MNLLKIEDNSIVNKESFSDVRNLVKRIADKTLEQLEKEGVFIFPNTLKDAEDITKEQMVLQSFNESFRSSNVMGFLGYGKERLTIESRFSAGRDDFFFQYLLEKVLGVPNILEFNTDANQDNRLYNLLLFLFPHYLRLALRKGIFKTYVHNQYNDQKVKGTIDIVRHITKNSPFVGNVAYNRREFSYDNYLMELIRHTIEFIKRKPYGNNLLRKAKDETGSVVDVTGKYEYYNRTNVIIENKKTPVRHAYYNEYRALQRLCIMILQHEKHKFGSGVSQIHGILFDGAWLFEEYINSLIKHIFHHPKNRGNEGAQRLFSGNAGLIYPDFIGRDKVNRVIADAKYKRRENIGNKDYLQVLAYMFRFDAKQGYYIYPEEEEIEPQELMLNQGSTYERNVSARSDVSVVKLGLHIPPSIGGYADFSEKMKISEQELISIFT